MKDSYLPPTKPAKPTNTSTTKPTTKPLPLSEAPLEGRLDVVAYKISERLVNALDTKMGLGGGLWGTVGGMVEEVIRENLPDSKMDIPEEVRMIVNILRNKGVTL